LTPLLKISLSFFVKICFCALLFLTSCSWFEKDGQTFLAPQELTQSFKTENSYTWTEVYTYIKSGAKSTYKYQLKVALLDSSTLPSQSLFLVSFFLPNTKNPLYEVQYKYILTSDSLRSTPVAPESSPRFFTDISPRIDKQNPPFNASLKASSISSPGLNKKELTQVFSSSLPRKPLLDARWETLQGALLSKYHITGINSVKIGKDVHQCWTVAETLLVDQTLMQTAQYFFGQKGLIRTIQNSYIVDSRDQRGESMGDIQVRREVILN